MDEREPQADSKAKWPDPGQESSAGDSEANSGGFSQGAEGGVKVISIDPQRLRHIKINNVSGHLKIVGTNRPEIVIRANSNPDYAMLPKVQVKQDSSDIELNLNPGKGWRFNFDDDERENWKGPSEWDKFDPDAGYDFAPPGQPNFDEGFERGNWGRPGRAEARSEGEERGRPNRREARRFWQYFDPETISNLAAGLGRGLSEMLGAYLTGFYVEVPNWVELEVKNISGSIELSNLNKFCRVKNSSGGIAMRALTGGAQINSMSGNLDGAELGGKVSAKVVSGGVRLTACKMSELDLSVASGSIQVETEMAVPGKGEYKINTTNGNVQMLIPSQSRASIECRSLNGRISVSPEFGPMGFRNRPGQNQSRLDLNGGGSKVSINAMNGNIQLGVYGTSDSTGWPETAAPPPPAPNWPTPPPAPPAPPSPFGPNMSSVPPVPPVAERPKTAGPIVTPPPMGSVEPIPDNIPAAATAVEENPPSGDKKARQLEILRAIERGELTVEDGMQQLDELND